MNIVILYFDDKPSMDLPIDTSAFARNNSDISSTVFTQQYMMEKV